MATKGEMLVSGQICPCCPKEELVMGHLQLISLLGSPLSLLPDSIHMSKMSKSVAA